MIAVTLSESEARTILRALGPSTIFDDPCEHCGHPRYWHVPGPTGRPCLALPSCAAQCSVYVVDAQLAAERVAIKRRIRAALGDSLGDPTPDPAPVRMDESPAYRQHMRDAGRGGLLR